MKKKCTCKKDMSKAKVVAKESHLKKEVKKLKPVAKKEKKVEKVMHEWKEGKLHSGSKKGPKVTSEKQAIAIALSEARKAKKKSK